MVLQPELSIQSMIDQMFLQTPPIAWLAFIHPEEPQLHQRACMLRWKTLSDPERKKLLLPYYLKSPLTLFFIHSTSPCALLYCTHLFNYQFCFTLLFIFVLYCLSFSVHMSYTEHSLTVSLTTQVQSSSTSSLPPAVWLTSSQNFTKKVFLFLLPPAWSLVGPHSLSLLHIPIHADNHPVLDISFSATTLQFLIFF